MLIPSAACAWLNGKEKTGLRIIEQLRTFKGGSERLYKGALRGRKVVGIAGRGRDIRS